MVHLFLSVRCSFWYLNNCFDLVDLFFAVFLSVCNVNLYVEAL